MPLSNGRLVAVWLILVMGIVGLAWRLYQLQIVQGQELQKRARKQQTTSIRPYIPRRAIVDSNGNVLATDRLIYTLYVHPKLFAIPPAEVADKLAPLLNIPLFVPNDVTKFTILVDYLLYLMLDSILENFYIAGEVLNIDAVTGGFNFQACWSEAWLIAQELNAK